MANEVHEAVVFKLQEGVDRAKWIRSGEELIPFLRAQPGFIDRVLLAPTGDEATWIDMARWESLEQAQAAAAEFERSFAECEFVQSIEPSSIQMLHLQPVATE